MSNFTAMLVIAAVGMFGAVAAAGMQKRGPDLVGTAAAPSLGLRRFARPPLPAAAVTAALRRGLKFGDRPSFGSGIEWIGGDEFLGVTDRGPNDDDPAVVGHPSGVLFPLPRFTPSVVRFRWRSGRILVSAILPIHSADGRGVTGLPAVPADGVGYDRPGGPALPPDLAGLDIEGIRRLPDGRLLLVDEYGPSLLVASAEGQVLKRYVPAARASTAGPFPTDGQVPAEFTMRRANRGFESVALSADGRRAWTIMESPFGRRDDPRYEASRVVRVLEWDVTDPLRARPSAQYLLPLTALADTPSAKRQDDIRISDAVWLSQGRLLVVERAPARVRLIVADFSRATNLLGRQEAADLGVDAAGAPLAQWGIVPAAVTVVLDTKDVRSVDVDSIEGVALITDREVVLANDNDFGMADNRTGAPARFWRLRWGQAFGSGR